MHGDGDGFEWGSRAGSRVIVVSIRSHVEIMIDLFNCSLGNVDCDICIVNMNEVTICFCENFASNRKIDLNWDGIVGLIINTYIHTPRCMVVINRTGVICVKGYLRANVVEDASTHPVSLIVVYLHIAEKDP